jgi:hypothetical protein
VTKDNHAELENFVNDTSSVSSANAANAKAAANGFNAQLGPNQGKVGVNVGNAAANAGGKVLTPAQQQAQGHRAAQAGFAANNAQNRAAISGNQLGNQQAKAAQDAALAVPTAIGKAGLNVADATVTTAAKLPTPGGIGLVLLCLLFFIFAVVPVNNGLTRAQLMYLSLTGKTSLPRGSSGSFGPSTAPTSFATPAMLSYQVANPTLGPQGMGYAPSAAVGGSNITQAQPDFSIM